MLLAIRDRVAMELPWDNDRKRAAVDRLEELGFIRTHTERLH